jgi:hypothetical protein
MILLYIIFKLFATILCQQILLVFCVRVRVPTSDNVYASNAVVESALGARTYALNKTTQVKMLTLVPEERKHQTVCAHTNARSLCETIAFGTTEL